MSKKSGKSFPGGTRGASMLFALLAAALCLWLGSCREKAVQYRTMPVERGDLAVEITASGTLNSDTTVQVGTQVSGTISRILVDFNSHVKKGQLIALLDTTFLSAAVQDAAASLYKAQSQEELTRRIAERSKTLFDKGLVAQADLDQAEADYTAAKTAAVSARAQLDRAKINLAYAYIRSPISGVVVNRAVDVGQTVAASFSTPTLFAIANDLTKMQVMTSVDEADIGQVKTGQQTKFTVDAYPNRSFSGTVSQIRLDPTTVQNVVSYSVMVDVDNPDLALLPGMTANITISVQQATDVLKVPLAALKFVPAGAQGNKNGRRTGGNQAKGQGAGGKTDSSAASHRGAAAGGSDSSATSRRGGGPADSMRGRIFVLDDNGKPVRIPVKTGLRNSGYVEIEGDVKEGQQVIVGILSNGAATTAPATASPLGGAPGMPRRF